MKNKTVKRNKEVLPGANSEDNGIGLKPITTPRREGGNIIIQLDFNDYRRGVQDLQFSVVGMLSLPRGEALPTNMNLKPSLEVAWGFANFRVISLKGVYHFLLISYQD